MLDLGYQQLMESLTTFKKNKTYVEKKRKKVHGDASFASDSQMKSKTKIIAKNTFAAEMIALLEGVEVTVYLEKVMKFLIENYKEKPTLFTNDIPVLEPTAKHFDISTKSRSLRIDFAYVKNNLKFIGLKAIHLENIITDVLTKKNIKNKIKNFWMTKQNNGKPEEAEEVFEHKL
uniref:Uncharacterized protein n=1 Tax=Strongyloides stercoralis TaxID=6248 RepID=A0AAF5I415_STRER